MHYVAGSFCETIKLPNEMPKIEEFYRSYKEKKHGMSLYQLADLLIFMLEKPDAYNLDGAKRHHNFRQFRHYRHSH